MEDARQFPYRLKSVRVSLPKTMKIGLIGGTGLLKAKILSKPKAEIVNTNYGKVKLLREGNIYFLQRHQDNLPPHLINHKANIAALKKKGIKNIIGVGSCGSLKKSIKPGDIVVPGDYINIYKIITFFDKGFHFTTPGLSEKLRKKIVKAAKKSKIKVHEKGIYVQTKGPRFETKAEINMFKAYADVLSMTLANEITLAKELKLEYAAVCVIDNYCHGIGKKISQKQISETSRKNQGKVKKLINAIVKELK